MGGGGSWFYNGGDGKFLKPLQIVGRRVLTTLFYEDPLYCLPSFFRFCPTPSLSPPISTPTVLSVMNNILSLGTLVPQGSWCVFYATRNQVYWALTHNVVFLWCSDLISYTHTQHTQGPVDWHTCIIIYWHHLLFAYSNYLYYIKWLNE